MADEKDEGPKGPTKSSVLITTVPKGHPKSAALKIYKDVPTRVSTCQICNGAIPPKGTRLILVYKLPKVYNFPNGSMMWEKKGFCHPECLVRDVGLGEIWHMIDQHQRTGDRQEFFQLCWDCRARVVTRSPGRHNHCVYTGKHRINSILCDECVKKPCWIKCHTCELWFPKREAGRAWTTGEDEPRRLVQGCKGCVAGGQLESYADGRRRQEFEDRMDLAYWQLRDRLKEQYAPRAGN